MANLKTDLLGLNTQKGGDSYERESAKERKRVILIRENCHKNDFQRIDEFTLNNRNPDDLVEIYTKFGDKTVGQILEGIYQARQSVKNQSPNLPFFNHMFRALAILYGSSTCRLMVSQLPLENHFFQNRLIRKNKTKLHNITV
uniref:Uncharacterized protein n=1 Tax=Romanomermis culicivorax TaxID=13658 RepID=A0A915KSF1_ROMCU